MKSSFYPILAIVLAMTLYGQGTYAPTCSDASQFHPCDDVINADRRLSVLEDACMPSLSQIVNLAATGTILTITNTLTKLD
ncbi:uncharacterized protein RCO7_02732 [Rhynchosporium graminicola]|uniref:Uncharacterized protein n=1 Tax=Rhynchosporium graminicola TaxID=2792576 RepID=A0A1E1KG31_9HELO|nr:uncharacterized protein RCO7_02732 [Rhynchosporium commune]